MSSAADMKNSTCDFSMCLRGSRTSTSTSRTARVPLAWTPGRWRGAANAARIPRALTLEDALSELTSQITHALVSRARGWRRSFGVELWLEPWSVGLTLHDEVVGGVGGLVEAVVLVGLPHADVKAACDAAGVGNRVIELDGKSLPVTRDYRPDRLNFKVNAGKITAVSKG